jgi:hypothetical protein
MLSLQNNHILAYLAKHLAPPGNRTASNDCLPYERFV